MLCGVVTNAAVTNDVCSSVQVGISRGSAPGMHVRGRTLGRTLGLTHTIEVAPIDWARLRSS